MSNILLWNARGIINKKMELEMHINKYDIIVITETKISKNKRLHFSGYKTFKSENEINCGGVAIIIKQGIEFNCIGTWKVRSQNIEVLGIRTKNLTINYYLYYQLQLSSSV